MIANTIARANTSSTISAITPTQLRDSASPVTEGALEVASVVVMETLLPFAEVFPFGSEDTVPGWASYPSGSFTVHVLAAGGFSLSWRGAAKDVWKRLVVVNIDSPDFVMVPVP
ncbi:hypothetical protein HEMA109418_11715 [Helcobacillus massiliensis]